MTRAFNPYSSVLTTEPDMRQELTNTIDGVFPEIAKGQKLILRKMRTSNGVLVPCSCVDSLTKEPDRDRFCPYCFGESYLWDEQLVNGYKVLNRSPVGHAGKETLISPGNTNLALVTFYFEYDLPLNIFPKKVSPDKIVELATDDDGTPTRPYQRETIYRIGTAIDFRSDRGKLEYYRLDCYEEQVKFLNGSEG